MNAVATGLRAALWAAGVTLGSLLLSSLFRQPMTTRQAAALAIFTLLSAARPVDALLIVAAFGPIISLAGVVLGFPFTGARLLETLVLLVLVPWLALQARWIRTARWRPLDWALVGLALIVAASAATHLPSVALRGGDEISPALVWSFFTRFYLEHPPGFAPLTEGALLLEGLGLCAFVSRAATDAATSRRIASMAIAGATGAAIMNLYRLLEIAFRRGDISETLGATFSALRINTQFGDLNAAGSYFAMALVAAAGLSDFRSRRGIAYAAATVPLALALWLSGSRAALAGAAIGIVASLAWTHRAGVRPGIFSRRRFAAVAALIVISLAGYALYPAKRNVTVGYSAWARAELTVTGLRMLADRPLLGVGVSRFYDLFPQYASPELRQKFFEAAETPVTHENAHNNFMQVLAELGVAGFVAFLLVLWLALRPDALDADERSVRVPFVFAIGAFLLTALLGHPLLTHEVAYPFWIALGLAAAGAPAPGDRWTAALRLAVVCAGLLLATTVPIRARYEQRHATFDGVALGMTSWQRDASGNLFRWAAPRSAVFVGSAARIVRLPLRATGDTACEVAIWLDGRQADRVTAPAGFWQEVRLRLPSAREDRRSFRIDLIAEGACGSERTAGTRPLMVGRLDK
jgi:hypothetical protein